MGQLQLKEAFEQTNASLNALYNEVQYFLADPAIMKLLQFWVKELTQTWVVHR